MWSKLLTLGIINQFSLGGVSIKDKGEKELVQVDLVMMMRMIYLILI